MKNLSKAYYKDYFSDTQFVLDEKNNQVSADNRQILTNNKSLIQQANRAYLNTAKQVYSAESRLINQAFVMEVRYPGLITGVGINHEAKIEGEFKLGIHFDYTTGLPIIYGSSVKGVLRSAFNEDNLLDILPELVPENKTALDNIKKKLQNCSLKDLANEFFGRDDNKPEPRSIYQRDIFFDALIDDLRGNSMLASDSITPHGKDPLKNPVPLTFVRIASGCKIKFRFRLVDGTLTVNEKKVLFQSILIAFGIGAKTNVKNRRLKKN